MEMYIEQGSSRMDCELKIASKYNRPFHILSQKEVRFGGFLGFFSKPGVQVEFYFSPVQRTPVYDYNPLAQSGATGRRQRQIEGAGLEEEKKKVLAAAKKNIDEISASGKETSQQILDALKEIKEKVEGGVKKEDHPAFVHAVGLLKENDFSESYINGMLEKLKKEMSLEQLENLDTVQDRLLEWIGESINIYKEDAVKRKPKIMVLVGPTGVGKTTTISKLAAIYGIGTDEITAIDVKMITIDAFRICAKEQLEQIGNIMQIPVSCVVNKQDLRKELALHGESTDLFLIDTIGKSPKDSSKLGEMKEILDGAGSNAEFHLVISAATKTSDIEDIMRQFEPFNYKSIVLTKMDETDRIGNIISALAEKRKCISYITDGQTVPVDIRRASVVRFLINLAGFKVNREKIESRFPSKEADQFKWR
ncbi:MAG: AAA family ATPase [Treponema sp.]|jgi:flagellar biosynthesis protein FlhF|nr:AAA family ATPase [Treponema sp.]